MTQAAKSRMRPSTYEGLSEQVRAAGAAGSRIRIVGSDSLPLTHFAEDSRPVQALSMVRMNKLVEHAVGDMTVIVQAGMTLEALQRELAWRDQWLPIDPPVIARDGRVPGHRTIGGLIASNSLGPLRFGCGDWRFFIMGMRWVDAAGRLIRGGGRTVKNVAGYGTPRMMVGSCGSVGIIAEVTLRTFARPEDERCALFFCDSAGKAEEVLAAVMVSPTTPAYVQVVSGGTFITNPLQLPAPPGDRSMVVVVGFLGRPEVCAAQVEVVRGLSAANGMETISQAGAQCGRLRHWMTTEPVLDPASPGVGFRMHARSSDVAAIVDSLASLGVDSGATPWIVSEAGSGVVRGAIQGAVAGEKVAEIAGRVGASLLWTQGRHLSGGEQALVKRIKGQIDAGGLFGEAPG